MPVIDPYANQMQTMQTLGIPVNSGQPATPAVPGATPAIPAVPGTGAGPGLGGQVGRQQIARAILGNRNFDKDAFRQGMMDWRAQRPQVQGAAGVTPVNREAFQAWRQARPMRSAYPVTPVAPNPAAPNPAAVSRSSILPG